MTFLEIKLDSGLVKLEFAILSGDKVVFVHFTPTVKMTLSVYKEWKARFAEILKLAELLGADEVLSFVPKNKPAAKDLQAKFGFETISDVPEGTLTRCTLYGNSTCDSGSLASLGR